MTCMTYQSVAAVSWILKYFRDPDDYKVRFGMFQQSANDFEQELAVKRIVQVQYIPWNMLAL